MKTLQGLPVTMLILGGSIDGHLGRIHEDFVRITCDNVDSGVGRLGSINSHLRKDPQTLQGLPMTMLILGQSINGQLRKDLQRICKDYL